MKKRQRKPKPCAICTGDPEVAAAVVAALLRGEGPTATARQLNVPMWDVSTHFKGCLPPETKEGILTARYDVAHGRVRDFRAEKEAAELLTLCGQGGETIQSLRASIPITEMGKTVLGDLFGKTFASRFAQDRAKVLAAFDRLAASTALPDAEIELRRRRIVAINAHNHSENERRHRRGSYEPRRRKVATRNDDWDI